MPVTDSHRQAEHCEDVQGVHRTGTAIMNVRDECAIFFIHYE